ncbi:SDR family oxidoreductase [Aspergillus homomorphus CBS 101889]|uniref:NAD(P)-binding protein n=1 Tax=Aspergillus homomorphus (strain CBS 101889) TaxID=1450537 RepID=A0A395HYD9_ASPHC|nr:NAD(P)-binding protein [Aspergillus homomorphus CBS 101889]RAL12546.1 NAD(P)-binding protein [Aspergillus homomorphus CBS 101889]
MVLDKPENKNVLKSFDLSGRVAAITGGARGIGLEVSKALAEAGANIAIIYNTSPSETANALAATLASTNTIKATAYRADVSNQASIASTVDQIAADFGQLDIIVVNSGIVSNVPAEEYTPEQWREIMKVNLDGAFWTAQAAARIFKAQGRGNVIFTASVSASLVNVPQRQAAYNASKAGVVQLAKCLAVEWVDFCRVNCISPGFIETEILDIHPLEWREKWFSMIPAQRMADAYELKGAYVFCASDASSYMTGANLVIDGGYTLP